MHSLRSLILKTDLRANLYNLIENAFKFSFKLANMMPFEFRDIQLKFIEKKDHF